MGHVVVGGPAVVAEVVGIGKRGDAVGIRREIDRLAECVRRGKREAVREAPHEARQQRVIVERPSALRLGDRTKRRIDAEERPIDVRVGHANLRGRLIDVDERHELATAGAHVADLEHVVGAQLLLHVHGPLLRVAVPEVRVEAGSRVAAGLRRWLNAGARVGEHWHELQGALKLPATAETAGSVPWKNRCRSEVCSRTCRSRRAAWCVRFRAGRRRTPGAERSRSSNTSAGAARP